MKNIESLSHKEAADAINELLKEINHDEQGNIRAERQTTDPDFIQVCGLTMEICQVEVDCPDDSDFPFDPSGEITHNLHLQSWNMFEETVITSRAFINQLYTNLALFLKK